MNQPRGMGFAGLVLGLGVAACGDVQTYPDAPASGDDAAVAIDAPGPDAPAIDAAIDAVPAVCGDGTVGTGETCDLGAGQNGQPGTCCTAQCQLVGAGTECRAAASSCDIAERCTGAAGSCPADQGAADGTTCTEGGGSTCCSVACSHTSTAGTCDACSIAAHGPQRIAIIESQSINSGHNMDMRWSDLATAAGHTATILPQTGLDTLAGLDGYDILIVSSGIIDLAPARRAVIDGFAASGRGVYLQAEYQITYTTNIGFGEIVNAHGASFTWSATVEGQQDPTTVNGCLASTPELATSLTRYWYAATGTASGTGIEVIHTAPGGQPIGWSFCLPGGGMVISNTDQDFIRDMAAGTAEHLRNVLVRLADAANCAAPT